MNVLNFFEDCLVVGIGVLGGIVLPAYSGWTNSLNNSVLMLGFSCCLVFGIYFCFLRPMQNTISNWNGVGAL